MSESLGKWHYRLWPIHNIELFKVIPLLLMKLLVSLNYTILYNTKDTLIVSSAGAEVLPILKGWVIIPIAFLFMLSYSKLSNHLSKPALFYTILSPFLIFFFIFAFLIYPNFETLIPTQSANWLQSILGESRTHWVAIYRFWPNSVFYVFAELWGVIGINLLFWTFANQISTIGEAKRFYTLFSAAGDLGAIISAPIIWHATKLTKLAPFETTLQHVLTYVIIIGLSYMFLYWYMNKKTLTDPRLVDIQQQQTLKKKTTLSLKDSLSLILKSKYLLLIAVMVISYSLALNLIEVFWKATLKLSYPEAKDYYHFMTYFSFYTGWVSLLTTLLIGGYIIRKFGWHIGAQITPFVVFISGFLFFVFYFQQGWLDYLLSPWGVTPLLFLVYYGAAQNILSKTCKYSFFDPTKEMAYIPLDEESKIKGKAAVDVVGSRLGKSGSSWLQAFLIEFVGSGSVLNIASFITPFLAIISSLWCYSVFLLNKKFTHLYHKTSTKKNSH
jgi:ATP:ADP antiporter, AAA family